MVAYNFHEKFIEPIRQGKKRQTIRPLGRRRHAAQGAKLQLYTGMRTAKCRRIVKADLTCVESFRIFIDFAKDRSGVDQITSIIINGQPVEDLEAFARADGFDTLADMADFFGRTYGTGTFCGVLITW